MTKIPYEFPNGHVQRISPTTFIQHVVSDRPGIPLWEVRAIVREARGLDDSPESRRKVGRIVAEVIRLGWCVRMEDDKLYPVEDKEDQE